MRGADNQNQTLVVNLSQQSAEKKREKIPLELHFLFLCTVKPILDDVDNKI